MDALPWPLVGYGSGWVAFGTLAMIQARKVANGEWVPRSTVVREQKQSDEAVSRAQHDANEWRTESRIRDQQIVEKDVQLRHLEEVGKTVNAIMRAIRGHSRSEPASTDDGTG